MKQTRFIYVLFILLFFNSGYAQDPLFSLGSWKHTSLTGEIKIKGLYRQQETILRTDFKEKQESSHLMGGIELKSKSYIWHPNFLVLDLQATYNPETRREEFLVIPDRSEARTVQKLNIGATFFKQKFISLYTFVNLDQNYINYENLSNVKAKSKSWGGTLNFNNKIIPISIYFNQRKWSQKEILTGRTFTFDQSVVQTRLSKSFSDRDRNEFKYSHNEFFREDANANQTKSKIDKIDLINSIYFDKNKKYSLNSRISQLNREESGAFQRFQLNEGINLKLPERFVFLANYMYTDLRQELQDQKQQLVRGKLKHKLYESLESSLIYENNSIKHTSYKEINNKIGIDIKYTKKIPLRGRLNLSYGYLLHNRKMQSDPVNLQILNEEYILADDQITVLNNPNVTISSVIVKDETGTIIYQGNLDYILIQRDEYLEIQRFPGGQIPNGTTVYIDYIATSEGSYHFDAINKNFNAGLSIFNQLLEVYYRNSINDYKNLDRTDLVTLNYITQNLYGVRVKYKFVSFGVEYDDYNSSIIPYKLTRYFMNIQKRFGSKFLISLNGNIRDYDFTSDERQQTFSDLSGKVAYQFNQSTKLNFDVGFRKQKGEQIDLDLLTTRGEFTKVYRKLFLTLGFEMYQRNYIGEILNFKGGFIQIARKF